MVVKFGVKLNQISPDTVPKLEEKQSLIRKVFMPEKIINSQTPFYIN